MKWTEVCKLKKQLESTPPLRSWRLMELQQRATGEWVACLFYVERPCKKAEVTSWAGWESFKAEHGAATCRECGVPLVDEIEEQAGMCGLCVFKARFPAKAARLG